MKSEKKSLYLCLFIVIVSALSVWVLLADSVYLGHDTLFHLSRIEGYANSIASGNFFADIYPLKNDGFGYGSALFYCDYLLLLPAVLYNFDVPLTICYASFYFLISLATSGSIILVTKKLTKNPYAPYLAVTMMLFANYRICNIYTRGAMGEVMAMIFGPLVIAGLIDILIYQKQSKLWLTLGLCGLIFSHNLSFVLYCIFILVMLIVYNKVWRNNLRLLIPLISSAILAFLLTSCFTLPMLQQTSIQDLYLHYYASNSDLLSSTIPFWDLFNPITVVSGTSSHSQEYYQIMNVSLGLITTLLPLTLLIIPSTINKQRHFIKVMTLIGYSCLLLATGFINFELLPFLRIIQFPFRFISLALPLLAVSAAYTLSNDFYYPKLLVGTTLVLILVGVGHQYPYYHHSINIDSSISYSNLLDGSVVDPYFGDSNYVRVEVAGADYLPIGSLNTKDMPRCIVNVSSNQCETTLSDSFTLGSSGLYVANKTYYLGYQICEVSNDGSLSNCVDTQRYSDGRVSFNVTSAGNYALVYRKTQLHKISIGISCVTLLSLVTYSIYKSIRK